MLVVEEPGARLPRLLILSKEGPRALIRTDVRKRLSARRTKPKGGGFLKETRLGDWPSSFRGDVLSEETHG